MCAEQCKHVEERCKHVKGKPWLGKTGTHDEQGMLTRVMGISLEMLLPQICQPGRRILRSKAVMEACWHTTSTGIQHQAISGRGQGVHRGNIQGSVKTGS
eukprot:scaffold31879_cov16-Tisochrysis_lutea.AAC.1